MGKTQQLGTLVNGFAVDANGNVGIGGSPSGSYKLDVTGTGRFTSTLLANGISSIGQEQAFTFQRTTGTASDLYSINADSGSAYLYNNTTSKALMTWLEGGNVGIGTGSPWGKFNVVDGTNKSFVVQDAGMADTIELTNYTNSGGLRQMLINSSNILFYTGTAGGGTATERMRITSGGNVSIGSTTDSGFRLYAKGTNGLYVEGGTSSSNSALLINNSAGDTQYLRVRGDGYLFSIPTYNNQWAGYSANMYIASDGSFGRTTPSSGRYKDNINDWNGKGLETILALRPKTFKYKKEYCETADIDFLGLIAEEVAEVSPYLAQYENPDRTGLVENVRYDTIVVPLIAAIQEQQEIINHLSAKVTALENK